MGIDTDPVVSPHGAIAFGDVHTLLGSQRQPPFAWVDHMGGTFLDALKASSSAKFDRVAGIAHAAPVFVPHHQILTSGGTVVDGGVFAALRTDLPIVNWALSASSGSPVMQAFREQTWGNEFISVHLDGSKNLTTDVDAMSATFTAGSFTPPGGTSTSLNEQGFTLFFQRQRFGTIAATRDSDIEVTWTIAGDTFKAVIGTSKPTKIFRGSEEVRSAVSAPNPLALSGGAPMADTGQTMWLQVMVVGGRLQVNAPNLGMPVVINLNRLWRADAVSVPTATSVELLPGAAERFPAPTFAAIYWPSGQFPTSSSRHAVSVNAVSPPQFSLSAAGIAETDQIAIVEPKITSISIKFTKFTQASFSAHIVRWATEFEYTSAQQGIGFSPDPSTPWKFDVSLSGETKLGMASGDTFAPVDFPHHDVTVTDATSGELSQYILNVASDGTGDYSYGGQSTARYTPAIERVCARVDGIVDDVDETAVVSTVFNLGKTPLASIFQGWSETIEVDLANLRINQSMTMGINNWEGIASVQAIAGFAGAGNIAALLRWGYKHQVGVPGGEGDGWGGGTGPGWARIWGYVDTYNYSSQMGSSQVSLAVKGLLSRLEEAILIAPPNIDGWNHFWAMRWLLNYAGIPDNRIGFMDMVPDAPDMVAASDPDGPNGYFLPIGVGSQPWTPIDRRMSVSKLAAAIQQVTGYILYADCFGVIKYERFLRNASDTPVRVFRQTYPFDEKGGLTAIWNLDTTISTADTRNVVAVVGLDIYNPAGSRLDVTDYRLKDEPSISSPPGSQPANYIGWRKVFGMLDSRFASQALTRAAAERMFAIMRLPSITTRFSCWGQPDIYALDPIVIEDWRSGVTGYPAAEGNWLIQRVMSISTSLQARPGGLMPVSNIMAMYIPDEVSGDVGDGVPVVGDGA